MIHASVLLIILNETPAGAFQQTVAGRNVRKIKQAKNWAVEKFLPIDALAGRNEPVDTLQATKIHLLVYIKPV
jgi:hypothetical protein